MVTFLEVLFRFLGMFPGFLVLEIEIVSRSLGRVEQTSTHSLLCLFLVLLPIPSLSKGLRLAKEIQRDASK
jgi:hypothetical protein